VFYSADAHRRDDEVFLRNPSANTGTSISTGTNGATTSSAAANVAKTVTHAHTATEAHTTHPAGSGVNAPGGALAGALLVRMGSHGAAPEVTPKHNPALGGAGKSRCANVVRRLTGLSVEQRRCDQIAVCARFNALATTLTG
jgi:hypothetical protein